MISKIEQTNRAKLYATALSFLGVDASPKDQAPDDYGCADSVSSIILCAFGPVLKYTVSTAEMFNFLNVSPDFIRTKTPSFGDIIISPTVKVNLLLCRTVTLVSLEKEKRLCPTHRLLDNGQTTIRLHLG
jgi:hypothetical protein